MQDWFDGEVNCASSCLAIYISFSFAYSTHTNNLCSSLLQPRFQGFFVTKWWILNPHVTCFCYFSLMFVLLVAISFKVSVYECGCKVFYLTSASVFHTVALSYTKFKLRLQALKGLNINKIPTRCNGMQIFIYCKVTLHVSGVTAPIIRSTKICNRSLRYNYFPPTWPDRAKLEGSSCTSIILYRRLRLQFLVLLMMGAVTPETCRVTLQ